METIELFKELLDKIPDFSKNISGIIEFISKYPIGKTIVYSILMFLLIAVLLYLVLKIFGYENRGKKIVLPIFALLYFGGIGYAKYEQYKMKDIDSVKNQVFAHLITSKNNEDSIKNINLNTDVEETKIKLLPKVYPTHFKRKIIDDLPHLQLIDDETKKQMESITINAIKNHIEENQDLTVSELLVAANSSKAFNLNETFINEKILNNMDIAIIDNNSEKIVAFESIPLKAEARYVGSSSYSHFRFGSYTGFLARQEIEAGFQTSENGPLRKEEVQYVAAEKTSTIRGNKNSRY